MWSLVIGQPAMLNSLLVKMVMSDIINQYNTYKESNPESAR